jgi:hypothetical protein
MSRRRWQFPTRQMEDECVEIAFPALGKTDDNKYQSLAASKLHTA